jgi:hypothetical protein
MDAPSSHAFEHRSPLGAQYSRGGYAHTVSSTVNERTKIIIVTI